MGEPDAARVDTAVLVNVANEYLAVADTVTVATRTQLSRMSFGAGAAGRDHGPAGETLRRAIDQLLVDLRAWSRANEETASAIQGSARSYRAAELRGAARLA